MTTHTSQTPYVGHSKHQAMLDRGFLYANAASVDGVRCDVYYGFGFTARMNKDGELHQLKTDKSHGRKLNWELLAPLEG